MSLTLWIVLFLAFDAVVVWVVVRRALAKAGPGGLGLDVAKLARFSAQAHEEVGRYLETRYSGDPQQLPQAMQGLMSVVRERARAEGLALDPDVLTRLIEASAIKHRAAQPGEIRSALKQAA